MNKGLIGFSVLGSLMTICFLWIVNVLTTPDSIWFVSPSFFLVLWPIALFFIYRRQYTWFSVYGALLAITFLIIENYLYSPDTIWFHYAVYPIIWWPIAMFAGRKAATVTFAVIASLCTIAYYSLLNAVWSPEYPWAIYPAYAVLWWPISLYYARKNDYFGLSVSASFLTIVFFVTVNVVSSPQTIWAVYPIFAVLWWPLSMYYFYHRRESGTA